MIKKKKSLFLNQGVLEQLKVKAGNDTIWTCRIGKDRWKVGRPGGGRTRYKAPVAIHLGDEEEIYKRGIWKQELEDL